MLFVVKVGDVIVCEVNDKQVAWNVFSDIAYSCYGDKKGICLGEELICSEPIRFTSNLVELEEIRLEKENLTSGVLKDIRKITEGEKQRSRTRTETSISRNKADIP